MSPPASPNRFEQGTKVLLGQASPPPSVSSPESNFPANVSPTTPPIQSFTSGPSRVVLSGGTSPLPTFDSALLSATQLANSNQFRQALVELSPHVNDTALATADRDTLMVWLDALAAKVIYSTEHHVEPIPYIVQADDTLETIARQWNVPQQLIFNINREKIPDLAKLQPGSELKKVTGPFRAEMDCRNHMVTLFTGDLYAGRFPMIGKAVDVPNGGTFQITQKFAQGNSQGEFWIGTSNSALSLHAQQPGGSQFGCEFSVADARDLFSILNVGSEIKILR